MDIVDFILDITPQSNITHSHAPSRIGDELYKAAKKYIERDKSKPPSPAEEALFHDEEEARKILELKVFDKAGDLAWMESSSWYCLPVRFRKAFEEHVDPLFWSGVYFSYKRMLLHTESVLGLLGWASMFVYKFGQTLKVVVLTPSKSSIDYLGVSAFSDLSIKYKKHIIMSIGTDKEGNVKFNHFSPGG